MPSDKKYYVYVHRRSTDGTVFYVGKGQGRRAWNSSKRSQYWKNIATKHGRTVGIVMRFDNEVCAFSMECALIKFYGRASLCNLTIGGDGTSGYIMSEKTKEKIGAKSIGRKFSKEERLRRSVFQTNRIYSDETKLKMSKSMLGHKRPKIAGVNNPRYRHEVYTFKNYDNFFIGTIFDFCNKYEVDKSCVCKIVSGKNKTHNGWSLS